MIDDKTPTLKLPLPHAENLLSEDVARLRDAFAAIDAAIAAESTARQEGLQAAGTTHAENLKKETAIRQQADDDLAGKLARVRILALAGL